MHYLRFGQMDQRDIGRLPIKFFRILNNKSRDEIEQTLMTMEAELSPREYKAYVYGVGPLSYIAVDNPGPGENIVLKHGEDTIIEFDKSIQVFGSPYNPARCNIIIEMREGEKN